MKFGKTLRQSEVHEWGVYYCDYKNLKQIIRHGLTHELPHQVIIDSFVTQLSIEMEKVERFSSSKFVWCQEKMSSIDKDCDLLFKLSNDELKLEKNSVLFQYAKKMSSDLLDEIQLLVDFAKINCTAFQKIIKKLYKKVPEAKGMKLDCIQQISDDNNVSVKSDLYLLKEKAEKYLETFSEMNKIFKPKGMKVYSIGCFDLFHRGHERLLKYLHEFGDYVVIGIHDDESYFKLKKKYPIDSLDVRINNIKPYCDIIFVIPSTDPTLFIKAATAQQDIDNHCCCYVRGDDMINFPSRDWVEANMPVYMLPRSDGVSSTLIRQIYHSDDKNLAHLAMFAKLDSKQQPIC
ncbi:hypothetical protein WA158_004402 [Blastocystis sp. Blastoise]